MISPMEYRSRTGPWFPPRQRKSKLYQSEQNAYLGVFMLVLLLHIVPNTIQTLDFSLDVQKDLRDFFKGSDFPNAGKGCDNQSMNDTLPKLLPDVHSPGNINTANSVMDGTGEGLCLSGRICTGGGTGTRTNPGKKNGFQRGKMGTN